MPARALPPVVAVLLLGAVAWVGLGGGGVPADPPAPPRTYVSLGDSLAVGVQPDAEGRGHTTDEGYPDRLADVLREREPDLRLRKLGCPGETTTTMVDGGVCQYAEGSQLDQAVAELRALDGHLALVTVGIGANDILGCLRGGTVDQACAAEASAAVQENLRHILTALRDAAGPDVPVIGMDYYNPYLALWHLGPEARELARRTNALAASFNTSLRQGYEEAGMPVAAVADAYATTALHQDAPGPGDQPEPPAVARVCEWTWMCAPPPRGPDIHANALGHAVVARTFADTLSTSGGLAPRS